MKNKLYLWLAALIACFGLLPASAQNCTTPPVVTNGLIGLWHLDGNTTDASGGGHNGTIVGTVTSTTGRFNNAYNFDGNSAIDCGNVDLNATGEFSVSAWVKSIEPYVTEVWRMVVSKLDDPTGGPLELFVGDGRDNVAGKTGNYLAWNGGVSVYNTLSDADPAGNARDGNWHHLAVTFKSGLQIVYFDGVSVASTTGTAPLPNTTSNFRIGGIDFGPFHHPWVGAIDEVAAYNRALSSAEIKTLACPQPEDDKCFAGNSNNQKVEICHKGKTICVSEHAVAAHLKHGDTRGKCPVSSIQIREGREVEEAGPRFSLAPNPSRGQIAVQYNSKSTEKVKIKVYDLSGATVFQRADQSIKGANTYQLNLSHLPAGSYYIELSNSSGHQRIKFVIQK